jgi:hypothetical protein
MIIRWSFIDLVGVLGGIQNDGHCSTRFKIVWENVSKLLLSETTESL